MKNSVLIIGYVWPEMQSSAAGLRTWNLVQTFSNANWSVAFASTANETTFTQELRNKGIPSYSIQMNDPGFDEWIRSLNPNYVIFDRFVTEEQFGWRVREHCPSAIRVLDTQDLHFLRRSREDSLGKTQVQPDQETCARELASIHRCDSSLILSSFEFDLLTRQFQISPDLLFLSRFHYPEPAIPRRYEERKDFVMIGNFRHKPNADGIRWFRQAIWPEIRRVLPEVSVYVYGAYPPKEMMNLTHSQTGFFVQGSTPDQFETLQRYRVNLAPLRFGAGIKGKITDGWWCGTPVVSTKTGAEGMSDHLPWGGEIAGTAEEFAGKAVHLYSDPDRWKSAQDAGLQIMRNLYDTPQNSTRLLDHFQRLKKQTARLREENWIGSMLWHHSNQSMKYFSKWIELKEKRPDR